VPCVAVIGDRELAEGSVSVRLRDENGSSRSMGLEGLASLLAASLRAGTA
jgi:threonyl-tRNA synthetase